MALRCGGGVAVTNASGLATPLVRGPEYTTVALMHFPPFAETIVWLRRTGIPQSARLARAA